MKCIPLNLISHQQMMVTRKTLKFLLHKFCASDELYHELSVFSESLPRSYLIKQKRNELNKLCHLERTQVSTPMAAQLSISTTLQDLVKQFLDSDYLRELPIITIMNNHGP